jgi:hypothetical protein
MDRTAGFTRSATFVVRLPLKAGVSHLRSRGGRRLAMPFLGSFTTSNAYIDPVPGQPSFIGDHGTGLLGFEPPRGGATGLVDSYAAIVLEFDEPIAAWSLRLGETFFVTRITTHEQVAGTFIPDVTYPGRRLLFVPTGGFGFDAKYGIGWDIEVKITTGITDLAGNPLKRAVKFPVFRTRVPE